MRQDRRVERLNKIVDIIHDKIERPEIPLVQAFFDHYFSLLSEDDVLAQDVEDLYGSMLSHWRFAGTRAQQEPLLNIYNPEAEVHGWRSKHTIIEIVVEDTPFLVDSLSLALTNHGLNIHLIVHPTYDVTRNDKGKITQIAPYTGTSVSQPEALLHFQVDRISESAEQEALVAVLLSVLADVKAVVEDWKPMRQRMAEVIDASKKQLSFAQDAEEWTEQLAFLEWLNDNHFTYIGFREFSLEKVEGELQLSEVEDSALGIYHSRAATPLRIIPGHLHQRALSKELLVLTKSVTRSTVHRGARMDYVGIKRYDDAGNIIGEYRFHGLYSSSAYDSRPKNIPILRRKENAIVVRSESSVLSHASKALEHILYKIPRDILMLGEVPQVMKIATDILSIHDRQRLKAFVVPDPYERFVQVLVLVPRDHYDTSIRLKIQALLMDVFGGEDTEFTVDFTESIHAQVHYTMRTPSSKDSNLDVKVLEQQIADLTLSWKDRLRSELLETRGESRGISLFNRYASELPTAYVADFSPRQVVADIKRFELLTDQHPLSLQLMQIPENGNLQFRILGSGQILELSQAMPWLENFGLRVKTATPYEMVIDQVPHWVLNIDIDLGSREVENIHDVSEKFHQAFARVSSGIMESDGFNGLVLRAGLSWEEVRFLRSTCKYLLQTQLPFSQAYMEQTLLGNADIGRLLVEYFHARFDPQLAQDETRSATCYEAVIAAIEQVSSLDEDRILRCFLELSQAVVRTTYYQKDVHNEPKEYLALKLNSAKVPYLPLPRPYFEIFVYSPSVEAIHLRGGKVARGGLRWSDRREDYRTEVLGLMKAQLVKNALIVPVGAKGGFITKKLPVNGSREEVMAEVQSCYRIFIRAMLDVTDNLVDGAVVPPENLIRHDEDDPYLVVAADKGTATFSDIANGIAEDCGFWLGDAFASGGSYGYDHKKMGITARGAWESVKRHFRERGIDTQQEEFTVAGIGDMAGDVFGNGMLLSEKIQLVAAFNHMHIFIDPQPDAATTFAERKRLFELPRSTWDDYDKSLLSSGGEIYSRTAKSITLSAEAKSALNIDKETLTPNELIQAILSSPVDLLWNGGIGTYVKATHETHADVGDRVNDAVRINAPQMRCKVVGEGGNLGFTQSSRIEFARAGGLVYADAIDNSGGVDCSDHEVNIKILLNQVVKNGDMSMKQRNVLLEEMSDEVADLVLRNNYLQTQLISLTANQSAYFLYDHKQLIHLLEREGLLNREIEFLPDDEELEEREKSHTGLSRPEIAVLLSYGKNRLFNQLTACNVAENSELAFALQHYFPKPLQQRFSSDIENHSLAGEIATTHLTNEVCDRMGSSFVPRMEQETGGVATDIVLVYLAVSDIFELQSFWDSVAEIDSLVPYQTQLELYIESRRLVDKASRWMLRHLNSPLNIAATVERFKPFISETGCAIREHAPKEVGEAIVTQEQKWIAAGVPEKLAAQAACLDINASLLDVALVAESSQQSIEKVAQLYFSMDKLLDLSWINAQLRELPRNDHWKRSMRSSLRESVNDTRRDLTAQIIQGPQAGDLEVDELLNDWSKQRRQPFERYQGFISEIKASSKIDISMLLVVSDALKQFVRQDISV